MSFPEKDNKNFSDWKIKLKKKKKVSCIYPHPVSISLDLSSCKENK